MISSLSYEKKSIKPLTFLELDILSAENLHGTTFYPSDELNELINLVMDLNLFDSLLNMSRIICYSFFTSYINEVEKGGTEKGVFEKLLLFKEEHNFFERAVQHTDKSAFNNVEIINFESLLKKLNYAKKYQMTSICRMLLGTYYISFYDSFMEIQNQKSNDMDKISEITLNIEGIGIKTFKIPDPPLEYLEKVKKLYE